jgi:PAP2 superfamily protein
VRRQLLGSLDGRAFDRLSRRSRSLDRTLPALSSAANRSLLWGATAALLAAFGGPGGRRAAVRGLVSIGIASPLVNGPLKLAWRRARPAVLEEPPPLLELPASFSFPSGHAASAFAFALGAGAELPALRLPLVILAGAVVWSRVYTRVHYPSDVLAGRSRALARARREMAAIGLQAAIELPIADRERRRRSPGPFRGGPGRAPARDVERLRPFARRPGPGWPGGAAAQAGGRSRRSTLAACSCPGYWYWGRPTLEDLRQDMRAISAAVRQDFDYLGGSLEKG